MRFCQSNVGRLAEGDYNQDEKVCCRFAADAALINDCHNLLLQPPAPAGRRLMQAQGGRDVAEPRPSGKAGLADPYRVELALDIAAPVLQKPVQLREIRGNIELLPDEALQQVGMIRQMVEDFRGRQSIIAQRLLLVAHLRALVRFALSGRTRMCDRSILCKKK